MPSRTIRPTEASAPAPFTYTLGAQESFVPQSISAEVTVPNAANDSYAVVSYYDPNGVLIGRERTSESIPFGETAEVSFYPFRRGSGASAVKLDDTFGSAIDPLKEITLDATLGFGFGPNPGQAILSALPQPAVQAPYAYGSFLGGNEAVVELTVAVTAALSFTVDATGITAQTAGVYLLAVNGDVLLAGPSLGDTAFSLKAEVNSSTAYGSLWSRPEAVPAGHNLLMDGGSTNPVPLAVADRVTFRVSKNGIGNVFTTGGRFLLLKVA